jgi:hypothetical protein
LAAAVLAIGMPAGFLPAPTAFAYDACRSDPVIVVDGTVADVSSTLWADPSVIRELDYTVTVPTGSLIGQTTLTVGIGFPEKVIYVYSPTQARGTLQIDATVQTQPGTAPFQTRVQVTTLTAGIATASGLSDATLTVAVDHQLML